MDERLSQAETRDAVADDLVGSGTLFADEFAKVLQGSAGGGIFYLCEVLVDGFYRHLSNSNRRFEKQTSDGPLNRRGGSGGQGIRLRWG